MHIDMDCFFCSVAVRGRPELAGMPVAVCWSNAESDKATHGEISSANYEARKYGIRAGMFIGKAKELCPTLISLPYEFEKYSTTAEALYRKVLALTPFVQGVSVDEAFAVYFLSHITAHQRTPHHLMSCEIVFYSTPSTSTSHPTPYISYNAPIHPLFPQSAADASQAAQNVTHVASAATSRRLLVHEAFCY